MVRALLGKLKQFKIEASSGSTPTIPLRSGPPAASTALDSARLRYTTLCKCMILQQRIFSFDIYPFKLCGRIGRTLKKNNSVQSQFWTVHSKMMMMTTTTTKRSARLLNTVGYTSEVRNTLFISSWTSYSESYVSICTENDCTHSNYTSFRLTLNHRFMTNAAVDISPLDCEIVTFIKSFTMIVIYRG